MHHQSIHEAQLWVLERAGQTSHNFKAKTHPQLHRALIRTDHKIELHRVESAFLGPLQ